MLKQLMLTLSIALSAQRLQAAVITINNQEDFNQRVLNSSIPVVVKFSGKSCPPCIRFAPVFERMSREFEGRVLFVAIDVDAAQALSNTYNVRSIPTIIYFSNGQKRSLETGFKSNDAFRSSIRRVFGL